jgi:lipoprotein-anchoring transpeptidase ErfK/SrfK
MPAVIGRRSKGEAVNTNRLIASLIGASLAALVFCLPARANILISVDKSTQRMTVTVDGKARYNWPVSTGRAGHDTPSGTFPAFSMDKDHRSKEYDNAPMPYAIFFTTTGAAVHGTYETRHLGRAASHGCVRLSVKNAATLWNLVSTESVYSTVVQVSGSIRDFRRPKVARAHAQMVASE